LLAPGRAPSALRSAPAEGCVVRIDAQQPIAHLQRPLMLAVLLRVGDLLRERGAPPASSTNFFASSWARADRACSRCRRPAEVAAEHAARRPARGAVELLQERLLRQMLGQLSAAAISSGVLP